MDVKHDIITRLESLPPELQMQVLKFVTSLSPSTIKGDRGTALRQFSKSLDVLSAQQMMQAIEEECERVDDTGW
jgi:hypothetical protein